MFADALSITFIFNENILSFVGYMGLLATLAFINPYIVNGYCRAAIIGWQLAGSCYQNQLFYEKVRWSLMVAIEPKVFLEWFDHMSDYSIQPFLEINPRLVLKPARVYMSSRWKMAQKVKVLLDTYQIIQHHCLLKNLMLQSGESKLVHTTLGKQCDVTVTLNHDVRFRKEGELVLDLWVGSLTRAVSSVAFSLERNMDGSYTCYIGCIQGGKDGHQHDDVIIATKAMHGIRPKSLLIFVVQEIGRSIGVSKLYGVGNAIQAHRNKHWIRVPFFHDYPFNYDETWIEAKGVAESNGWYRLPLETHKRSIEEIKTNKRSMYSRRYKMMDDISHQIISVLTP